MTADDTSLPSFEQLVGELSGPLSGYLRKMLGNTADADDLFQESLMRIARGLPNLKKSAAVKSWAFRIASNVAIDYIRKNQWPSLEKFTEEEDRDDVDEEDRLMLDEMNSCVREVIDCLPPNHRAAIVLFNLEGKSIAETAEILGTSVGATKVRIHRAKAHLEEALNRECTYYTTRDGTLRCDRKHAVRNKRFFTLGGPIPISRSACRPGGTPPSRIPRSDSSGSSR